MNQQVQIRKAQVLVAALVLFDAAICASEERTYETRHSEFAAKLDGLAAKCDELKLHEQAAITRSWIIQRGPRRQYLFPETTVDATVPPKDAPNVVQYWHKKFLKLRTDHANNLFERARKTAKEGDGTTSYQLLHEVIRHDSTHQQARRILGLGSPTSTRISRRAGTRTHADFKWRRGKYWQIESQYYRITTNASAEAGVELAKKLETFHSVWRQVFFDYWSATESLNERFLGGNARLGTRKKLAVVLFADRDEYVEQLQRYEPQIAMSLGYYMKGEQTAFFYAGDASVVPTWYHEATHQLFQELGDSIEDVGELSNFWIVEGIAVYMESLVQHDGYVTVGGVDAERLQYARVRALSGEFYIPLKELVQLGREDLQRHEEIRRIYTQSAGLSHFLMDGTNRKYRRALVDLLTLLYLGRTQPTTLAARCDAEFESLDTEYRQFLVVQDDDLDQLNPPNIVRSMALGRTKVTDAGINQLANYSQLQWLDLSFTKVTDEGLARLKKCTKLRRLNLEATEVSDESIAVISRFSQLEDLDLSNTKITGATVTALSKLKQLKVLWLTGTDVTDDALQQLEGLTQLEFLEVSQTSVTQAAMDRLKSKLPKLNRE